MQRRTLFKVLAGLPVAVLALMQPPSVFAKYVRNSDRMLNRNGRPHTERRCDASMPYVALEDPRAFHEIAETIRLQMIERLRGEGAPINVWRVGMMGGIVATAVNVVTGEAQPWKDEHHFFIRTRVSAEVPPFLIQRG